MSEENRDEGFREPTAPAWAEADEGTGDGVAGRQEASDERASTTPDASQTQVIADSGTAELPVTPPPPNEAPLAPPTAPGPPRSPQTDALGAAHPYASQQPDVQGPSEPLSGPQPYGAGPQPPPWGSQQQQPYVPPPPGGPSGPTPAGPTAYGQTYGAPDGAQNPYARNPHAQAPTFQQPTGSGTNTSAIVLLVLSALMTLTCLLTQIPALIMAIVALSKNANDPQGSRRLTRYGWIAFGVGALVAVIVIGGIIALVATSSSGSKGGYSY